MPALDHSKHKGLSHAQDGADVVLSVRAETVAGGSGFVDVSGDVVFDLSTGHTFFARVVGNVTSWGFVNVPELAEVSPAVRIVFLMDATGGYLIENGPTVAFRDGASFADLNTAANAENELFLWTVGTGWRAALVWNGALALDPYVIPFAADGTGLVPVTRAESIDLGSVTHLEADGTAGTGTLAYTKNGVSASGVTSFAAGDVLGVTRTGGSAASSVSIPRTAA